MEDKNLISKIKHKGDIKESIQKAVNLLGGWKKFISPHEVVLLKPNYNTADPFPGSTSLDIFEAIIPSIYAAGAKAVIIGESSTFSLNTRKILEKRGVFDACQRLGAKVYVLEEREWVKKEIPQGKYLKKVSVSYVLDRVDRIILLPCLKTHIQSRFTASLKLAVGFMKAPERVFLHLRKLEEKVAELNTLFKPDLIIMDARKCFVTRGPDKGDVREPNLILAGIDRIAIDVEGLKILKSFPAKNKLDLPLWEFPQIKRAVELGLGAKSEEDYELIEG
ncbi:MAG TPA: DUF362 domain-containing protein [Candidatus Parcubacteria bacterium]|jgi:uncharacterized protein (DUF362 family)|nr:DUF362 domain-containing protein [Candidatus Parcubacteria bacterium]|tara:strand:- start:2764 stop:3597 length:834 start_codon:yes stop_codon:yes gene_type:complete